MKDRRALRHREGDPQAQLTDALGRIADHKITRFDDLLP